MSDYKVKGWWIKKIINFINYFKLKNNSKKNKDQIWQMKKLKKDEIEKKINFINYFK